MGAFTIVVSIVTGEVYRSLSFENQKRSLIELMRIESEDQFDELKKNSVQLGVSLQQTVKFNQSMASSDWLAIQELLDNQFHQYFVTAGLLKLEKITFYDSQFTKTISSREGADKIPSHHSPCPTIIAQAKIRKGSDQLKPLHALCVVDGYPYYDVIIPAGGLIVRGYLEIVTAPHHALMAIEKALGMPIRIKLRQNDVYYSSLDWPDSKSIKHFLIVSYDLESEIGGTALKVELADDISDLTFRLSNMRVFLIAVVGSITLLVAVIGLMFVNYSVLAPIERLKEKLQLVQKDRSHLGEIVVVEGNTDIQELAVDFNEMTTELSVLYQKLEFMAFKDPLTSLPNRARFQEHLNKFTHAASSEGFKFSIFIMDLNRFKEVNDTLGHHVGDRLLRDVGTRLRSVLRESDIFFQLKKDQLRGFDWEFVARLGGDEFAALLPTIDSMDKAAIVARKIITVMDKPFMLEGRSFSIGISIGIALSPIHGVDGNTLMRRADVAMYVAKNRLLGFSCYESEQDQDSLLLLTMENELRDAIKNNHFVLYYQPKIHLATNRVYGVEALLRWNHPQRGMIPPAQFIPLAEQSTLINPLTYWVLDAALKQINLWKDNNVNINMAINISALNFMESDFETVVVEKLREHNIEGSALTLELTESEIMSDPDRVLAILTRLSQKGIRISIDDFGTGYSSLSYLKKLPVSEIKIDKTFISDIRNDVNDEAIVRSTIDLARNMGLISVAEGVEDLATMEYLKKIGCDIVQGYYVCYPISAAEFIEWLKIQVVSFQLQGK